MTTVAVRVSDCRRIDPSLRRARVVLVLVIGPLFFVGSEFTAAGQSADRPVRSSVMALESSIGKINAADDDPVQSTEPLDLSFDDLKFDIAKGVDFQESMLTAAIKKLDGRKVRLRGFVRPGYKQSGIKNFVLVRDNQQCCFGPGAALYDCVMVKMADDAALEFTVRPICVVGTLQLKNYVGKDGKTWAIFRMNDTRQE